MAKLYLFVFILFLASVFLFVAAFVYLDKAKHKTYYYTINLDGHDAGNIRIEKFITEDKVLYKSLTDMPFGLLVTSEKRKIVLNKKYNLESYSKESLAGGAAESVYLENKNNSVSFVATSQSEFASLKDIPIKEGTFVFEEDSLVTYPALIENYDFKKGRFQGFNAITHFSTFLPPMKRFVTLTSVRDEHIQLGSRRIKTECMFVKIRGYPQISIWVAKSDRSLVMLDMPDRRLRITRTFAPKTFQAQEYQLNHDTYISRDAVFKNGNVKLAGTLTIPKKEGKHPAALLAWGPGPQDREYQGFFTSIADYLSREGFCTLRFDRRGIGASGGDYSSTTGADEIEDLKAALGFLADQMEVDPQRIAALGHSEGALYAANLALEKNIVKAIVLMAPIDSTRLERALDFDRLRRTASGARWSDDYLGLAMKSVLETKDYVVNTKHSWASILGRRCFLKKMREELNEKPMEVMKRVNVPVFILQGKEDEDAFVESAAGINNALEESGNKEAGLLYFGYMGHFFGEPVNDGMRRMHYEVDGGVLEAIKNWLARNLAKTRADAEMVQK